MKNFCLEHNINVMARAINILPLSLSLPIQFLNECKIAVISRQLK